MTDRVEATKYPNRGELVFHRYGDSYFLSEVFDGGGETGRSYGLLAERMSEARNGRLAQVLAIGPNLKRWRWRPIESRMLFRGSAQSALCGNPKERWPSGCRQPGNF